MTKDLNTLLTALYVLVDDHVVPARTGRGHRPDLTDSELICLAVAQIMLGYPNERRWVRHVHATPELVGMFPAMLGQSGYHRRLKTAQPLLCKAILTLAACCPSWFDDLWITDATPVPCGMSRETVKRSDLAGHAHYGYCASHSRWYWGLKLYLVCAGDGMPIMWCLADPKIGEREVLAALLDNNHHLIREGQILLADKGFSGKEFKQLTESKGLWLLRPDRKDETYRNGNLGGVRQWIESVNQTLKGQLDLERHGGRTPHGVFTRVAQRLLALAAGIWHNWTTGVTSKRSLTARAPRRAATLGSSFRAYRECGQCLSRRGFRVMLPLALDRSMVTAACREATAAVLKRAVDLGLEFKLQPEIYRARLAEAQVRNLLVDELPEFPSPLETVLDEFTTTVLPLCKNEASPRFLGFGDTGDDVAALAGGLLALFTQQNLINQSFDSPSATFVEIAVLRWLRELIGFTNPAAESLATVWDVGGIVTHGGTMSNTVAMMLAREHQVPGTMERGVVDPGRFSIVVPRGIGHYSVKSALTWIGVGSQIIEVDTHGCRYDLGALRRALREHAGRVMAVVAYAGDSRTQTVDDLRGIHDLVRAVDERIWLHADACWGLLCAFSDELRPKIDGIADFDSVTVDPHKVMAVPYSLSALLVREPASLRLISSYSDLIMQEDFAFGQVTPFIGTKGWLSLKLWMLMRTHGRAGLARLAEQRVDTARRFAARVDAHPRLLRIHDPDLLAVAFVYLPSTVDPARPDVALINQANQWIHHRMLAEGAWHLHQFSIPDDTGVLRRGATMYPLRFMAANPRIEDHHMAGVLDYVLAVGREFEVGQR